MIDKNDLNQNEADSSGGGIAYIQQMLGEMRTVAKAERADLLAYLIEMAYVEAGDVRASRRSSGSRLVKRDKSPGMTG